MGTGGNGKGTLLVLPVKDIDPTPDNPRVIDEKDPDFRELLDSVKAEGVLVPVAARPHPKKTGRYMLIYGERRLRAAQLAPRDTVDALVYAHISDQAAFDLTFTENYGREDLTPLEQGKAVDILMKKYDGDVKAVASKLGWTEVAVRMRAKLKDLSPAWRKVARDSSHYTAAHLAVIARLPVSAQDQMLKGVGWRVREEGSVKDLQSAVNRLLGTLKGAPWMVEDSASLVPTAGTCAKCTKRSGAEKHLCLWEDLADASGPGRCLDPGCYQTKQLAYVKARRKELQKEHPGLVLVSAGATDWKMREKLQKIDSKNGFSELGSYGGQTKVKQGTKGAKPALIIHGPGTGKVCYVKKKASSSGSSRSGSSAAKKSLRQLRAELNARRWVQTSKVVAQRIAKSNLADLEGRNKPLQVLALLVKENAYRAKVSVGKVLKMKDPLEHLAAVVWPYVAVDLSREAQISCCRSSVEKRAIDQLKEASAVVGLDADAVFARVSQEPKFKEPAGWANLKADGTPKTVSKKKAKPKKKRSVKGVCRVCGCTESTPCMPPSGACSWTDKKKDLCTACVGKETKNGPV